MDHMMPEMDGVEATARIRAWEKEQTEASAAYKPVPVVALTANAVSGMKEMFLEKGFNDFLFKPIDVSRLNDIIGTWIPKEKQVRNEEQVTETDPSPVPRLLPLIAGVDTVSGLVMCGGTAGGYKKVLSLFRKDAEERLRLLKDLLDKGITGGFSEGPDRQKPEWNGGAFTTQVHALKSALATIGASGLSAEAAALEAAGTAADLTAVQEGLPGFVTRLAALAEAIGAALESAAPERGDEAPDRSLLRELTEALTGKKAAAIDRILAELHQKSLDGKTREALEAVSDDVLMTEYGSALKTVAALLETTSGV
jgi:CheY-like chemotaxis protein